MTEEIQAEGHGRDRRRGEVGGAARARAAAARPRQVVGAASRCSPRASAACSASATSRPACSRASPREDDAGAVAQPAAEDPDGPVASLRPRGAGADRGRDRRSLQDRPARGRRRARGDLHGRQPRPADRQARPDDRRGPVPGERDRVARAFPDDRKQVVVDASGYRARREATLASIAQRSAERALELGSPGRARADDRRGAQGRPPRAARLRRASRRRARAPSRTASWSCMPAGSG